jgi:phosphoethanolamine N-methyltransferase
MTSQFIDILEIEVNRLKERKEEFLKQFTQEDYDHLVEGWKSKLVRCGAGDQSWGLFTAIKPLEI